MVLDPEDIEWDGSQRRLLRVWYDRRRPRGRGGGCLGPGAADPPPDHGVGAAMIEKQPEQMTEAELADYYYAHRDDPDMVGEQVKYVPPRAARIAVRLSFEEEDRIRQAAQGAGLSVSAFLRQAGLSAARADVVNLERLRRDLNEARARIDDAWQALK